jgi:hypothetical protein
MAGDWMKIELELPDKPEVHGIAAMLNIDPDCVVGKLIRVWQWFDKHTTDGNAYGVTFSLPDRISGVDGFGEAMQFVGWLEQNEKTLSMPKFDRHTSESAKTRALSAKRQSLYRNKCEESNAGSDANSNANTVTSPSQREEKRREYKNKDTQVKPAKFDFVAALIEKGVAASSANDFMANRKTKKLTPTETAFKGIVSEIEKSGMAFPEAIELCCRKGWGGFEAKWLTPEDKICASSAEVDMSEIVTMPDGRKFTRGGLEFIRRHG